ncbi:MAG: cobalt-precorrin-5B (C(1))-methyltransferase [Alphaproteobacteria bacterium]|jgi:cobalt-precorrin-5B (C1)-methyltransferase|nr:cobalt-precorrin-5B (C(1))-methyltransferase [Alphaproteobacteria bacterium]
MARKPDTPLKRGWTTGACATAAVKAAYTALLTGDFPDPVTITLPRGQKPAFALARESLGEGAAMAGIIKDAGDDPDVTHLAMIEATVRLGPGGSGVAFKAGPGVGTVTKPGLPIGVGEPAINPVPRALMTAVIETLASEHGTSGDVEIEISVPGGEALAEKTWNPRLGIMGGLSILGTTGIVVPYSCAAWIASIHRGIDVARASGTRHVGAATGSTSEAAVRRRHGLGAEQMLDMGDFAGGMLKYLRGHPVPRLTIGGGFAKLTKLAQGLLDLHSGRGQVDMEWLARESQALGAGAALVDAIRGANTAMEALTLTGEARLPLGDVVASRARETALGVLSGAPVAVEVVVFDRAGQIVGVADGW